MGSPTTTPAPAAHGSDTDTSHKPALAFLHRLSRTPGIHSRDLLTRLGILAVLAPIFSIWQDDHIYLWLFVADVVISVLAAVALLYWPSRWTERGAFSAHALVLMSPLIVFVSASLLLWMSDDTLLQMFGIALLYGTMFRLIKGRSIQPVLLNWDMVLVAALLMAMICVEFARSGLTSSAVVVAVALVCTLLYFLYCADAIVRVRAKLNRAQKIEVQRSKVEAIGRLTGGVAHDFNNLLTVILGNIELAQMFDDPAERKRLLYEAQLAGERATRLTSQLLAFSRQSVLNPQSVEVHASLRRVEAMLRRLLPSSIEILVRPDGRGLPPVFVDPDTLETVLVNLAINARDAMPGGGHLRISVALERRAHPDMPGDAHAYPFVEVTLSDTGEGISPEHLARVTEPFYTTKPVGQGSGLGLSMAKGFVEQSGGTLSIDSTEGAGTQVTLSLPALFDAGRQSVEVRGDAPEPQAGLIRTAPAE